MLHIKAQKKIATIDFISHIDCFGKLLCSGLCLVFLFDVLDSVFPLNYPWLKVLTESPR